MSDIAGQCTVVYVVIGFQEITGFFTSSTPLRVFALQAAARTSTVLMTYDTKRLQTTMMPMMDDDDDPPTRERGAAAATISHFLTFSECSAL